MTVARVTLALAPANGDAPHDLYLDATGNLALAMDAKAVGQHARQRIMAFEGEWFLDTTAGLPWFDTIFGRRENLALAEALIKNEILDTDGVTGITGLSARFDPHTRSIAVSSATVITEYDQEASL
ncbi:hypothetical protein [Aureimonas ureilytica]|uniref:hypothetical protein n=1 Tax=Aureimonas ureilytica TaxID=401562 RepID=UPI000382A649|nr:hypothetical protein [Aureimonas ureilytica]